MSFYTGLQSVASNLLASKGQNVTFSRETITATNPVTGTNTRTTSTFTAYGVATNYNKTEIDGTIIQSGDIKFIMEGVTAPKQGDSTTIDSIVYRVMGVVPVSPAGVAVIYKVQLRK